jgi:hypothetical protein
MPPSSPLALVRLWAVIVAIVLGLLITEMDVSVSHQTARLHLR